MTIIPGSFSYQIIQGADFNEPITLAFKNADGTSTPWDLTGSTVTFNIKDKVGGTIILSPTVTVTSATQGQISVNITGADTTVLPWTRAIFELWVNQDLVLTGNITVRAT